MSSVIVSATQDPSLANSGQLSLRESTLADRIKTLREITLSLLTELESLGNLTAPVAAPQRSLRLEDEVKRFEIALIRAALVRTKGNQARAAALLGVKHTTLNAKIKRYQLQQTGRESDFSRDEQEMVA